MSLFLGIRGNSLLKMLCQSGGGGGGWQPTLFPRENNPFGDNGSIFH